MNPRRVWALLTKEALLMRREVSNLAIGILMPVILLVIFGYGLSLDISHVTVCACAPQGGSAAREVMARLAGSEAFNLVEAATPAEVEEMVGARRADAGLLLSQNFEERPEAMIIVHATFPAMAKAYENALKGILRQALAARAGSAPRFKVRSRIYYNPSAESHLFLVPGVVVIVMALIGCILTAMQMAGEYERGTLESLYATPVRPGEVILAKILNNFVLGMTSFTICLAFSHWVFHVPVRGSVALLFLGSALFLLSQMAMGLLISSLTKSQFASAEISMVVSFMPVFMLSGFLYEIPNMPMFLQVTSYFLPARYYVEFLQTVLLTGNVWPLFLRTLGAMGLYTVLMLLLCRAATGKSSVGGVRC